MPSAFRCLSPEISSPEKNVKKVPAWGQNFPGPVRFFIVGLRNNGTSQTHKPAYRAGTVGGFAGNLNDCGEFVATFMEYCHTGRNLSPVFPKGL